jgi:hypothetical protein
MTKFTKIFSLGPILLVMVGFAIWWLVGTGVAGSFQPRPSQSLSHATPYVMTCSDYMEKPLAWQLQYGNYGETTCKAYKTWWDDFRKTAVPGDYSHPQGGTVEIFP